MKIGVNTFGIAGPLREDFAGTLQRLSEAGITVLEPMVLFVGRKGGLLEWFAVHSTSKIDKAGGVWQVSVAEEKLAAVRAAGFTVESIHMVGPWYQKEYLDRAVAFGREHKLKYFVFSPMEDSLEKMAKELPRLRLAARVCRENGITVLLHNHEKEWKKSGGECVFDFLLETVPDMDVELDLGWTKFAGKDCVEVMRRYRDRIRLLHFKDVKEGADERTRDTCFTAIGCGSIPLAEIMEEASKMQLEETAYIIDQDDSLGDIMEDVRLGAENIARGSQFVAEEPVVYNGPLKLSLMTYPLIRQYMHHKLSLEELHTLVSGAGLHSVDMMDWEVRLYGKYNIIRMMKESGLHVECLISAVSMIKDRDRVIKKGILDALKLAKQLGCPKLMLIPFSQREAELHGLPSREELVQNAIKYLRLAVIAGKKYGIKICIEDTPTCRLPLSGIAECRRILEAVPGLGLVYDTANMIPGGDDTLAFYEELKAYICHVHLKDVRYTTKKCPDVCRDGSYMECCPWGEGIVPVRDVVKRLIADGYSGSCAVEYAAPKREGLFPNMDRLEKFICYLNDERQTEMEEK